MTLEELCRSAYLQTASFYETIAPELGEAALGYKILYGPPKPRPDTVFLGIQPGGSAQDAERGERDLERVGWPNECDYAVKRWRLAVIMRRIFGIERLEVANGLNLCFFRAPNVAAWRSIDQTVRRKAEDFSGPHARSLVEALDPKQIIVVGLGDFGQLMAEDASNHQVLLTNPTTSKVLIRQGELWGLRCIGTVHLSGSRLSLEDLSLLESYFGQNWPGAD